jgi:hypothetical protein
MEGPLPKTARLRTYIDALRILAKSDPPDRVLIEKNVDLYLEEGPKGRALEDLRSAIHNEESERREGEDWTGNTFTHCCSKLNPRMLPDHQYPFLSVNRCSG